MPTCALPKRLVFLPYGIRLLEVERLFAGFELTVEEFLGTAHPPPCFSLTGREGSGKAMERRSRFRPWAGSDTDAAISARFPPYLETGLGVDGPLLHTSHDFLVAEGYGSARAALRADLAVLTEFFCTDIDRGIIDQGEVGGHGRHFESAPQLFRKHYAMAAQFTHAGIDSDGDAEGLVVAHNVGPPGVAQGPDVAGEHFGNRSEPVVDLHHLGGHRKGGTGLHEERIEAYGNGHGVLMHEPDRGAVSPLRIALGFAYMGVDKGGVQGADAHEIGAQESGEPL